MSFRKEGIENMKVNGTLMNYYFHCKRQCYLFGNRLNLEDNSEEVKIGKAIHEQKAEVGNAQNTEIAIENIRLDKLTKEYLTEVKKSDADVEASKWQLIFYLKVLKEKGIIRKGKLEFVEKNKIKKVKGNQCKQGKQGNQEDRKILIVELTDELEEKLEEYEKEINDLLLSEEIPPVLNKSTCKKCAYYEYCYI